MARMTPFRHALLAAGEIGQEEYMLRVPVAKSDDLRENEGKGLSGQMVR